jgi:UDP-glucuronate decarboxylase
MMRLMATPAEFTGPVNLGNATEFTIAELAKQVIEITGSRSRIVHRPLPQDDPVQRKPDCTLAERELKWRAATPLADGLRKTVQYFDELLSGDDPVPAAAIKA